MAQPVTMAIQGAQAKVGKKVTCNFKQLQNLQILINSYEIFFGHRTKHLLYNKAQMTVSAFIGMGI